MQTQQLVLQPLAIILPVIGVILPGFLKQDRLLPVVNGLLAFCIVITVSGLQAWIMGQLGVNPFIDLPIVAGGISALLAGPFKPVDRYIQSNLGLGTGTPLSTLPVSTVANIPPTEIKS